MPRIGQMFSEEVPTLLPPCPDERQTGLYRVGGQRVVSVTESIKACGLVDFDDIPPAVLENAKRRGQWSAHYLNRRVKGIEIDMEADDPSGLLAHELAPRLEAFQAFLDERRPKIEASELVVVSHTYQFAGTLDLVLKLDGRRAIVDTKLPDLYQPAWAIQTAGYQLAYEEQEKRADRHRKVEQRYTLQLAKTGRYRLTECNGATDIHDFLAAARVASWKRRHGARR